MADNKFNFSGFGSAAVHAGHEKDPRHAHVTPIYASSTYSFDTAEQGMKRFTGEEPGYIYSRWGNPTFTEAENKIAALESFGLNIQVKGLLHASGMSAITTLMLSNLKAGDKILTHYSLYGGTEELLLKVLSLYNIEAIIVDLRNLEAAEDILKQDNSIKMMYLETPANPTIRCVDIEALTTLAKKYGLKVACDNTFATPYLQQPFRYGVDFVIHSTTKFLNGHGNMIGGILLGSDMDFMTSRVEKTHRLLGSNANPFDAFLLINGLKTLELRMERHCSNAMAVAEYLSQHAKVAGVNYTWLPSHPDHALAKKQMQLGGGMLSFELKEGFDAGVRFMNRLQMCVRTVSLGTCDTLLCHAASMTHYGIPKEQREQYGITDGLIRMNVGIENVADIIADIEEALR